jgi:fatty acid desaturase
MDIRLTRNDVVAEAKALKNSAALGPISEISVQWLQIVCALALFYLYPYWWIYIPVVIFVSARQYALAVLLHDAQHTLLHTDKTINQRLGAWLVAAPLGAVFADSQKNHLDHHFNFGSRERDPDYALYCYGDPARKQSISQLARRLGGTLFGERALQSLLQILLRSHEPAQRAEETSPAKRNLLSLPIGFLRKLWPAIVVQVVFFATFSWLYGWYGYFALWFLPLATLTVFYNDVRIFCEHSLIGRDASDPDERMVTFISNPIERFFFAPNHMNYHAEHHLFPYVPHRNLPALRETIRKCPELYDRIEWRRSYLGHLRGYISGFRQARAIARSDGGKAADNDAATQGL